jgi:hypothetical protein
MEAKEKAKQIANKYFQESDLLYEDLTWTQAKECASIAVNEIIVAVGYSNNKSYWEQVFIEIDKL